jgi:Glycosyl hydrolases family 38 N-terminal domain
MTTRRLVRPTGDLDWIRRRLREYQPGTDATLGGQPARLVEEPLLRSAPDGSLLQSLRVEGRDGAPAPAPDRLAVRGPNGTGVPCLAEHGPNGSVRLLLPAVDSPTKVTVSTGGANDGGQVLLSPQRRWTVHLIHHSHLDIGYTDPQGRVLAEGLAYLDDCLELVRATDDWPEEARFRWCVESFFLFKQWAAARPAERVAEFLRRVREGRIELTAMPFNLHTETCATEELHELLRPARELARREGLTLRTAMQTDVPGSVVGLVDALAIAGIRYLSVAHNWAGRSVPYLAGGANLPRLFRWRAPSGREVLVWMTDTPHGLAYMEGPLVGFDIEYGMVDDLFPAYLSSLAANPYPYPADVFGMAGSGGGIGRDPYPWDVLHLRVQGRFGDNAPPRRIVAEMVRRWNETWAFPRLRLSRNEDFFADAEARLGGEIQAFEGDWTDWWVDGVGSGARPMSLTRVAQSTLADGQTISAVACVLGAPDPARDTREAAEVYEAISLFNEHTWGAAEPHTHADEQTRSGDHQWVWKYGQGIRGHDGANSLLDKALARLGTRLAAAPGVLASYHIVNTRSWPRTDTTRIFLPESVVPLAQQVRLIDARTGREVAHEEQPQANAEHRAAGRFLLARVDDVPSLGAVRLDVLAARLPRREDAASQETGDQTERAAAAHAHPDPTVLENEHLRVRVDLARACVASLVDKATGRELVRAGNPAGFNGYLHDRYAVTGMTDTTTERLEPLTERAVASPAALADRRSTATAETLVYETRAPGTRVLRTTLTLPRGVARLDIENRLAKDTTLEKESAFFAFPFALDEPVLRAEATGGVTGSGLPVVPGSAPQMRAVRHWVTAEQGGFAVAWSTQDAPLVQLGDIAMPYPPYPGTLPQAEPATIYSWVHNNIWDTNFPAEQRFEFTFRYSVACARTAELAVSALAERTAAGWAHPLLPVRAMGPADQKPPAELSLAEIGDPRIALVDVVPERNGQVLLRLRSFAEEPVDCQVRPRFDVACAHTADYLGVAGEQLHSRDGNLTVPIATQSVAAVLLTLSQR